MNSLWDVKEDKVFDGMIPMPLILKTKAHKTLSATTLGLVVNSRQFSLLVLVNAFVGAMVGRERSILLAIAEQ